MALPRRGACARTAAFLLAMASCSAVRAQQTALDFFKGKTITIVTSTGPGGGYDLNARLIARFMPRYIPGVASVVVQNMPGGGNLRAANYMFEVAPKDGTIIGVVENGIPLKQVLEPTNMRFDVARFNWLGSTGGHNEAIMALSSSGVQTIDDLRNKEVVLGGTGASSTLVMYPAAMNNVLGTKFKIVTGYTSSTEIYLAMDRSEVVARSGTIASLYNWHSDWVALGKIKILTQIGLRPDATMPGIPLMMDLATKEDDKRVLGLISSPAALGNPYYAPPGVPADRLALLSTALASTLKDPDFLKEAEKIQAEIAPMSGPDVARIIDNVVGASNAVVERARLAIEVKEGLSR